MTKRSTFALAITVAMLGSASLGQIAFAQSTVGATAAAAGDAKAPAGDTSVKMGAGADASGKVDAMCPDGTPKPAKGACPAPAAGAKGAVSGGAAAKAGDGAAKEPQPSDTKGASGSTDAKAGATSNAATESAPKADAKASDAASGAKAGDANSSAATNVKVTTEQRTTIVNEIKTEHVEPVTVNFTVNVGVVVPHEVHLRSLPATIIKIVPRYRGYLFFVLADGRIVIVEPHSLKIVLII